MKWLGIAAIVLALALAGRTFFTAFPPTNGVPDPGRTEDLSAWVLEPTNPPTPSVPLHVPSASIGFWQSVANRNSNPLNIKLGAETRRYVDSGLATVSSIIPKDGGRFLRFDSPATGFRAGAELLGTRPYDDLRLDGALRRWSNNGFGAEILSGTALDGQKPTPHLGRDDLETLLHAIASAEGYRSSTIAEEIKRALQP